MADAICNAPFRCSGAYQRQRPDRPDPAAAEGNEAERWLAFGDACLMVRNWTTGRVASAPWSQGSFNLRDRLDEIGETPDRASA